MNPINAGYEFKDIGSKNHLDSRITGVLDEKTIKALELNKLVETIDSTLTQTGKRRLYFDVFNPSVSKEEIELKQNALDEIASNDELRQDLYDFTENIKDLEENIYTFLKRVWVDPHDYQRETRDFINKLPGMVKKIKKPESLYIKCQLNNINVIENSKIKKLVGKPLLRQWGSKLTDYEDLKKYLPPIPFNPSKFKPTYAFSHSFAMGIFGGLTLISGAENFGPIFNYIIGGLWGVSAVGAGYLGNMLGKMAANKKYLTPLKKRILSDSIVQEAFNSIGAIDELLSFHKYSQDSKHSCIPKIVESEGNYFKAKNLINPVQATKNEFYVPNNLEIGNISQFIGLTGPNSGGKTSLSKAITQVKIQSQIGCYGSADDVETTLSDRMIYQIGSNDSQDDDEGGLGVMLLESKDNFDNATSKTFMVVDDLIDGTTSTEKLNKTMEQITGLSHIKPLMLYITHHFELADKLNEMNVGDFRQMIWDGQEPTYIIGKGISRDSHSERVAAKIGFTKNDMATSLINRNYLDKKENFDDISGFKRKYYDVKTN